MPVYAMEKALNCAKNKLISSIGKETDTNGLRYAPEDIPGDIAFPCFPLAKALKKNPAAISSEAAARIAFDDNEIIKKAEAAGGYINFYINSDVFCREVINDFLLNSNKYGRNNIGAAKKIIIDYSSPNIAKPFSIGHLRSTNIGAALKNILLFSGYDVIGDNHLGDWGTQFGKLIYAYKKWGSREEIEKDPIKELLKLYVKFHDEAGLKGDEQPESDEEVNPLEEEARKYFKQLEDGEEEIVQLWKWIKDISLKDFQRVYDKLQVSFEEYLGESFYNDKMEIVKKLAADKNILSTDPSGTQLIRLEDHGISTPLLIQKKDGASLYATRDLAGIIYRKDRWDPSMILYVVGEEQQLYFKQLFKVKEMLGIETPCEHIQFGLMVLPEGKVSTRKGNVIFLEDVLEEAQKRVSELIADRELSEKAKEEISAAVGIGAVKYHDLSQNRKKTVTFDWEKMLALDGNSSPYLQYSYSRAKSIIRKSGIENQPQNNNAYKYCKDEIKLIKKLALFPETVESAGKQFYPHIISTYLFELAQEFSSFYNNVKVMSEDKISMGQRILIVGFYASVMKTGLSLLGIGVLEEM